MSGEVRERGEFIAVDFVNKVVFGRCKARDAQAGRMIDPRKLE